uniref:Uncharacterized protein n=2 Tax=Xiphophorus TaxID=8082 RepID=A0A3B5Q3B5_XIPMA
MRICIVPDICGSPPSTAVNTNEMNSFFSLSRGCDLRIKLSIGLSVYLCKPFIPISGSIAFSSINFEPTAADSLISKILSSFWKTGALSLMSVISTVTGNNSSGFSKVI